MNGFIDDTKYDFIVKNTVISCVDICIEFNNKILLVKRNEEPAFHKWFPPGGRIFIGESIFDAAVRKSINEVGIDINPIKIIHVDNTIFKKDNNIIRHSLNVVVYAKTKNDNFEIKLDKYIDEFAWFSHVAENLHPYVKKCLYGCGLK